MGESCRVHAGAVAGTLVASMEAPKLIVPNAFPSGTGRRESGIPIPPLKEVLRDEDLRSYILAYATKNYQDESLLFWIAADDFLSLPPEKRLAAARSIWDEFLAPSSEHEVTVEAAGRAAMGEFLTNATEDVSIAPDLFEPMKVELENVMTSNVYSEYCKEARRAGSLDFAVQASRKNSRTEAEEEEHRLKGAHLMENLVIEPDNFSVLYALCQVYTIVEQHDEEEKAFLSGVVEILLEHNVLLPFLDYVIAREVDECTEVNTLFRGRTVFVLLLGDLLNRRACQKFLSDMTSSTFSDVLRHKGTIEVDPTRIDDSSDSNREAVRNAERLTKLADALLDNIRKRYFKCPPSLRKVFELLSLHTAKKFPELRWKMVGAVFFLRFINPALSQPEKYGLVSKEVTMGNRRALVMLSKMLQFVTNNSRFDTLADSHKLLNVWIDQNVAGTEELFSQLVVVLDEDWAQSDVTTPRNSKTGPSPRRSSVTLESPKGSGFSPGHSPRTAKASTKWAQKLNDTKDKLRDSLTSRNDKLGRNLTREESQALRLQVLDTLIKNQDRVKELLSGSMSTQTQWMWLKESLSSFLK